MDGDDPGGNRSRKKTATKSTIIDHTYYDYSTRELSELLPPDSRRNAADDRQKGRVTFPMKLHNIVSNPKYRHIIRWMPHGRSWKIIDKELLASVVCKENFNHENFDSINRSINGWGFKRLISAGPDHKSYYHELFLRGRPELTQAMTRLIAPGKRKPDPKGEPNFYEIAKRFPLPADPYDDVNEPTVEAYEHRVPPQQNNPIAYDTSRSSYARAPPGPAPSSDYRDAKRQRQERYSFPPDASHYPTGFMPGYGHPPAYHPGYTYDYGFGQYPPPYPPYPYHYPTDAYGVPFGHHQNPYTSPERHFSVQSQYNEQQWNQAEADTYNHSRAKSDRNEEYDQNVHDTKFRSEGSTRETHQNHSTSGQLAESLNSGSTQQHTLPLIHEGTASTQRLSNNFYQDPSIRQQYVFPSYGASSSKTPFGGSDEQMSGGDLKSPTVYETESSILNQEGYHGYSAEVDERKPAAIAPSAAQTLSITPVKNSQHLEWVEGRKLVGSRSPATQTLSITPVRNSQRLEWTESFSKDICNYLLEDEVERPSKIAKDKHE
eukprot:scaffold28922_cov64-Cyclotella_meneghiniana.AAC.2